MTEDKQAMDSGQHVIWHTFEKNIYSPTPLIQLSSNSKGTGFNFPKTSLMASISEDTELW